MLWRFICLGLVALTSVASGQDVYPLTTPAGGDVRFDPVTGTDRSRWPKPRPFDFERLTLELDFPDVQVPVLTGIATYRAAPVAFSQEVMLLDCDGPVVSDVSVNGSRAGFTQEGAALRISLPNLPPGRAFTLAVKYSLDFSANKGLGLTWVGPEENAATDAALSPMIHSQGQSELNSKWFPCFDSPNERLATELIVTVDADYEVISNGKLISRTPAPLGSVKNPRTRWTWRQERPHPVYLVALAIGKWSTVSITGSSVPLTVHGPPGSEDDLRLTFAKTPEMIQFFERTFGVPYPWDRYAQVLIRNLDAGGMENTAATFIRESTFTEQRSPGPGSLDGLIAHELAHQWFGNLITCRSWAHLWLNEGLATYAEALWREHAQTPEAYLAEVRAATRSLIAKDTAAAPEAPALVSHVYTNPDDRFGIAANPYSKGMMILHMLRRKIGDGPFFAGLRSFTRTHADGLVETADLRRAFEASSGVSLERFFEQWTLRPGVPRLRVEASWNPATQTLSVECDQTQRIDRLNPAYALDVPIHVRFEDGTVRVVTLTTDSEKVSAKFVISEGAASTPVTCEFDPQVFSLASILPRVIDLRTGAVLPDWEREPEPALLGSPEDDAHDEIQPDPDQIRAYQPTPTQP